MMPGLEERGLDYDDFKAFVRSTGERQASQGGLVPIPELRRNLEAELPRPTFDDYVFRLHREGFVHLMSHVDPQSLPEAVQEGCIAHPTGTLLYWIRWL